MLLQQLNHRSRSIHLYTVTDVSMLDVSVSLQTRCRFTDSVVCQSLLCVFSMSVVYKVRVKDGGTVSVPTCCETALREHRSTVSFRITAQCFKNEIKTCCQTSTLSSQVSESRSSVKSSLFWLQAKLFVQGCSSEVQSRPLWRLLHVFTFLLRSRLKLLNWISVQPSGWKTITTL